jgi:hypothetical protein
MPQVNDVVDQFKEAYGPTVSFEENAADPSIARHIIPQSISVVLIARVLVPVTEAN